MPVADGTLGKKCFWEGVFSSPSATKKAFRFESETQDGSFNGMGPDKNKCLGTQYS